MPKIIILFLLVTLFSASAHALTEGKKILAADIVTYLETQLKARPLSEGEQQALTLAKLAKELGASIPIFGNKNQEEILPKLDKRDLSSAILIFTPADWTQPATPAAQALLKEKRKVFEENFSVKPGLPWAWMQYNLGEKKEGLAAARALFTAEIEKVQKLKKAVYTSTYKPLSFAEKLYAALAPLSDQKEKAELDAGMKKMKDYVETLPKNVLAF